MRPEAFWQKNIENQGQASIKTLGWESSGIFELIMMIGEFSPAVSQWTLQDSLISRANTSRELKSTEFDRFGG